ncbi:alpha/beta hydrolase-fold protein [Georgenia phoenicis]|uniref:alpha/beta hydrolase-fold protein n=1 Tax=unclassified Georgenia TaxID=2626815 RepID=UPI0039AF5C6A
MSTTRPARTRGLAALAAAAVATVSLGVALPADADEPAGVEIDLSGTWRFTKGDDARYSDPDLDDSAWQELTVPEDGAEWADEDGYGWYRVDFELPADAEGTNLVASLGYLDDVDEAFLNGVRIGGSGQFPPDARSAWFERRLYPVPADAPVFGGTNTLAVRMYDMNGGGGWYQGPIGLFSKDKIRENVHGIRGVPAEESLAREVRALLDTQRAALAAGDLEAYLDTVAEDYFHDGRDKDRRARELAAWLDEAGTLELVDREVEVVASEDGRLLVDTNRSIVGTVAGETRQFQETTQEFLAIDRATLREEGNHSRFFRESVDSELEGKPRELVTYLPPSYLEDPEREFPVVYLLHGINGGAREWEPRNIDEVLDGLWEQGLAESIVVMPDGESLWYVDSPAVPWRSMFLTELVPMVDAEYRTLDSADYRALTGISMGGFGAYSIGLENPGTFSSLASHMGALSFAQGGKPTPVAQVAGMTEDELGHYDLFLDACEADEYRFDNAVRTMSADLSARGVPHTAAVYPEGRHNDACWMPRLADSFATHSQHFRDAGLGDEALDLEVTVRARCLGTDRVHVLVNAQNPAGVPVAVTMSSEHGTREFPAYSPRRSFTAAFSGPTDGQLTGRVVVTARSADGAAVREVAAYAPAACG